MVRRLIALAVCCAVALTGCTSTPKVRNDPELDAAAIVEQAIAKDQKLSSNTFGGRDVSVSLDTDIGMSVDGQQMDMTMELEAQESTADELLAVSVDASTTMSSYPPQSAESKIYIAREGSDYRVYLLPPGTGSRWAQASATEEKLTELLAEFNSPVTMETYLDQPVQLGVRAEGDSYVIEAQPAKATLNKILASQQQDAGMQVSQVKNALVTWTVNQQTYYTESFSIDLNLEVESGGKKASFTLTAEASYSYDPVSLSIPDQARHAPEVDASELDI